MTSWSGSYDSNTPVPFAVTAEEWRERWEEATRAGLRWKRVAENREERIDRLRHAVADLRAEVTRLRRTIEAVTAVLDNPEWRRWNARSLAESIRHALAAGSAPGSGEASE
jgi:flagellar biosynthesis chaperone FliJ